MNGYSFRRYRAEEEAAVAELMRALDAEGAGIRPISDATIERTLGYLRRAGESVMCAVVEAPGGRIVGYAMLFPFWSCEYGGEILIIDEIYLESGLRGKGLGAGFMRFLEEYAITSGRVAITFGVMSHNTRAMGFFEALGYNRLELITYDKILGQRAEV